MYDSDSDFTDMDPDLGCEYDFTDCKERKLISDSLVKLGFCALANYVLRPSFDGDFVGDCISVINSIEGLKHREILNVE